MVETPRNALPEDLEAELARMRRQQRYGRYIDELTVVPALERTVEHIRELYRLDLNARMLGGPSAEEIRDSWRRGFQAAEEIARVGLESDGPTGGAADDEAVRRVADAVLPVLRSYRALWLKAAIELDRLLLEENTPWVEFEYAELIESELRRRITRSNGGFDIAAAPAASETLCPPGPPRRRSRRLRQSGLAPVRPGRRTRSGRRSERSTRARGTRNLGVTAPDAIRDRRDGPGGRSRHRRQPFQTFRTEKAMSAITTLKTAAETLRASAARAAEIRVWIEVLSDLPDPVPGILGRIDDIAAGFDRRSATEDSDAAGLRTRLEELTQELRQYLSELAASGRDLWGSLDSYADEAENECGELNGLALSLTEADPTFRPEKTDRVSGEVDHRILSAFRDRCRKEGVSPDEALAAAVLNYAESFRRDDFHKRLREFTLRRTSSDAAA